MIMNEQNLQSLSTLELLRSYDFILDELIRRKIVRTHNNPLGDYAEWLVAQKLCLTLAHNSESSYDGVNENNEKFQIKSRRNHPSNGSRQFNVIRNYEAKGFDFLITVLFNKDFTVKEAYKLPYDIIPEYSRPNKHQNGRVPILPKIIDDPKIEDISNILNTNVV